MENESVDKKVSAEASECNYQEPPEHASRESIIQALKYWILRATKAEEHARHCPPAPEPSVVAQCGKMYQLSGLSRPMPCQLEKGHTGDCSAWLTFNSSALAPEPVTREQRIDQWLQRNYAWTHDVSRDEAVGIMAAYAAYEAEQGQANAGALREALNNLISEVEAHYDTEDADAKCIRDVIDQAESALAEGQ